MDLLAPGAVSAEALRTLREQIVAGMSDADKSRYADELRSSDAVQRLVSGDWPMHWSSRYRFVSDDPLKVLGQAEGLAGSEVLELLVPVIKSSQREVSVISPYFVPGEAGTAFFVQVDQGGSAVRILTNSLAANDVAMVYGGYSEWREPLLEGGVELWELKPAPGRAVKSSMFGSSGASLHTKALEVDGRIAFVGSYNLDPRSTSLNCEQGIFVESPEIAAQLAEIFRVDSAGDSAWSVTLVDGQLRWSDGTQTLDSTPDASAGRKFQAWIARVLPVSSQL
jgi:putative cardiolipin synthase